MKTTARQQDLSGQGFDAFRLIQDERNESRGMEDRGQRAGRERRSELTLELFSDDNGRDYRDNLHS